jgi:biopolymer transport protein ExbD
MGEIIQEESGKKEGGKPKPKKHSTHIDMTPMVDLMCLLITFFMLTTAFSKPKVMTITMPEKDPDTTKTKDKPIIQAGRTINILIAGDNKVYWYTGSIDAPEGPITPLTKTNYSKDGLRKVLLEKNKDVFTQIEELKEKVKKGTLVMADTTLNNQIKDIKKGDKKGPIVLIKAGDGAKYRNIVDIVDEMAICNIGSYAIVDMSPKEQEFIKTAP